MLAFAEIAEAVEIQRRSHALLRYVAATLTDRTMAFDQLHDELTHEEAAAEWLGRHWQHLPEECRPAAASGPPLTRFANFFASYLYVSYDLDPDPGEQLYSRTTCWCELCTYLGSAPKLRPKRVDSAARHRARLLTVAHLGALAAAAGRSLDAPAVDRLLADPELSRDAALATYGAELLRRCDGLPSGPEALALWRKFAWTAAGAPVRGFELQADAILAAEQRLLAAVLAS